MTLSVLRLFLTHNIKEITEKLDFIKIKNSSAKENVKKIRRQDTDLEKIFSKD